MPNHNHDTKNHSTTAQKHEEKQPQKLHKRQKPHKPN